jgi:hypothetical protein
METKMASQVSEIIKKNIFRNPGKIRAQSLTEMTAYHKFSQETPSHLQTQKADENTPTLSTYKSQQNLTIRKPSQNLKLKKRSIQLVSPPYEKYVDMNTARHPTNSPFSH